MHILFQLSCALFLHIHSIENHFRLYHTTQSSFNHDRHYDCIYHYVSSRNGKGRHLVPYCMRPQDPSKQEKKMNCYGKNTKFSMLRQKNVSAYDLLLWFAPTDLITEYQWYLITGNGSDKYFCNCTKNAHSFGVYCQYKFAIKSFSLDVIINEIFAQKYIRNVHEITAKDFTCYLMFNCTTYTGLCLDWRQICDGKRDCRNARDEEHCLEMELNECDLRNEYRCLNGMCIPRSFMFDFTMDCPDFYDEQVHQDFSADCFWLAAVECEEHHCGQDVYNCGDGSCLNGIRQYCPNQRNEFHIKSIFAYNKSEAMIMNKRCFELLWCGLDLFTFYKSQCNGSEWQPNIYDEIISFCPLIDLYTNYASVVFPPRSFVFPFLHLVYSINPDQRGAIIYRNSLEICYNVSLCQMPISNIWRILRIGLACAKFDHVVMTIDILVLNVKKLFARCFNNSIPLGSGLLECKDHRFISKDRFFEPKTDCELDESGNYTMKYTNRDAIDLFVCTGNTTLSMPRRLLHDGYPDCPDYSDELSPFGCMSGIDCQFLRHLNLTMNTSHLTFSELCNGNTVYKPLNGETDETNCEEWPCKSATTHCDGVWNRPNGCDELDCPLTLPSAYIAQKLANCSSSEHYCLQYNSDKITCLPLDKANDGYPDCLFSSDERWTNPIIRQGKRMESLLFVARKLKCSAPSKHLIDPKHLCDNKRDCSRTTEDELLCPWLKQFNCLATHFPCKDGVCLDLVRKCDGRIDCPDAEDEWACDFVNRIDYYQFSPIVIPFNTLETTLADQILFYCHRGLLVNVHEGEDRCLCPPSYYGLRCEFQSQRLTLSFDSETMITFDQNTVYRLVFYLLDDYHKVLSTETLIYAPSIHSMVKHLVYLLYPHLRPMTHTKTSVHIDAYLVGENLTKHSLSWRYPVQFPFLPVNRLAFRLFFEERQISQTRCAKLNCKHGTCQSFVNIDLVFCRCQTGWSGETCNQTFHIQCNQLNCDPNSQCIVSFGYAFCLCPIGRMGTQCRVPYNACQNIHCANNGTCVTLDERTDEHFCQCPVNYFGNKCQYKNAHLTIQIPDQIAFAPVLNIHMLQSVQNIPGILVHRNTYFYRNVQPKTDIVIIEENQSFLSPYIVAQIMIDVRSYFGTYYLLFYESDTNVTNFTVSILRDNRCPHISEYLDAQTLAFPWLKRVKFYHKYFKHVKCFYDEIYMCLIDHNQLPDCYLFNHDQSNCSSDRQYCQNGGRCFQRKRSGQLNFVCVCPECIAGSFCQLNMDQFSLTLESMFGRLIIIDQSFSKQPIFIKIILILITLLFSLGLISNIISIFTFVHPNIRQCGVGHYLLTLSIVSQFTLTIFTLRFIYMLSSQITIFKNIELLNFTCISFDFILSLLVSICDWLTACIACERVAIVIKAIHFNKSLSIRMVKIVIPLLIGFLIFASCHHLFNRILITDPYNENRLWCVTNYRYSWLQYYDIIINLIISFVPFLINLITTIVLLVKFVHTKQRINKKKNYVRTLFEQFYEHKDLLLSPLLMIIFKLPLFIVKISIRCIKYDKQLYISILIYLISYVPLAATFIVFIWPSRSYYEILIEKRKKLFK